MDLEVFQPRIKILKVLGIWVTRDSTWLQVIYSALMQLLFVYIFTIFLGLYIVRVTDLIDFADQMSSFLTYVMCTIKCINLFFRMDSLRGLFRDLQRCIKEFNLDEKFLSNVNVAYFILKIYWIATFSTVFLAGFVPFVADRMAYPMWFPYSLEDWRLYYLSALYQWIGTLCYSTANVSMDMMPVLFMGYFLAMLDHLRQKLEALKKYRVVEVNGVSRKVENTVNSAELINCIDYQRKIIDLSRRTQDIFSAIIFIQGFFSSVILCTSAYALTKLLIPEDIVLFVKLSTYMMAMTWQIAIPCYYGTLLSSSYEKVSESLFHTDWMLEDRKYRYNVRMFMEYSKQALKFTAFKMFDIDLETFMRILNSAYSLFAVFKRVN